MALREYITEHRHDIMEGVYLIVIIILCACLMVLYVQANNKIMSCKQDALNEFIGQGQGPGINYNFGNLTINLSGADGFSSG